MIKSIIIFNIRGKARAVKFFESCTIENQQKIIREAYQIVSQRAFEACNFVEMGNDKIVYRQYATLYFAFIIDSSESEYDTFDLIHSFVQCLDQHFENVCELDLIFHSDQVNQLLNEYFMGGFIVERNSANVLENMDAQSKLERSESGVLNQVGSKIKSAVDNKREKIKIDVERKFSKVV